GSASSPRSACSACRTFPLLSPFWENLRERSSARARQILRPAVPNSALHGARIEAALEQFLTQLALGREPQEQPRERGKRDERALDHHHGPGEGLVVQGGDAPAWVRMYVEGVEDAARPEEDVPENRLEQPDDGDVAELGPGPEPFRAGQRLDDRRPHQAAEDGEAEVLEGMNRVVVQCRLVHER